MEITRREFIKMLLLSPLVTIGMTRKKGVKEAYYYESLYNKRVRCLNCPHGCVLSPSQRGICRVRENIGGRLYTIAYGNPCALHVDPIEKKPLFHFLPASYVLSVAIAGCNFRCKYCQNWSISQRSPEETNNYELMPEDIVAIATKENIPVIAYTYSEPSIFYEYMLDTAKIARRAGIRNVWVTNGFLNKAPLLELCNYLDAANVDIKWFTENLYREISGGSLAPVLETCKTLVKKGIHLEVTNLVVPTLNDKKEMIEELIIWIRDNLGSNVPLHFSRFSPMYRLQHLPPTPIDTLITARELAIKRGMQYVYIGNYPGGEWENTYCPSCKKLLIERKGYTILKNNIQHGRCKFCGYSIYGVWE